MSIRHSPHRRRFVVPLIVLAAAAGVAIWGTQNESRRTQDVRQYVLAICQDVANRTEITRLGRLDPIIAEQMVNFLRVALNDLGPTLEGLEIDVRSGDSPEFGNGSATHTAMIRVKSRDTLGLRIVHQDQGGDLGIIGLWWP